MRLAPILYTSKLDETVQYYTNTLGFKLDSYQKDWGWARLINGHAEVMISLPNEHLKFSEPKFTGSIYFYADNIDQLWMSLKDKVEVAYPINDFDHGMREFALFDINGYLLQFGQDVQEKS